MRTFLILLLLALPAAAQETELLKIAKEFYDQGDPESALAVAAIGSGIWPSNDGLKELSTKAAREFVEKPAAVELRDEQVAALRKSCADLAKRLGKPGPDEDELKREVHLRMVRHLADFLVAYKIFNRYRIASKVRPVTLDYKLSYGDMLHARYLSLNGYDSLKHWKDYHDEDPKNPHYTKEGQAAAQRSDVSAESLVESIAVWVDTYYHRLPMFQPHLTKIGVGTWDPDRKGWTPSCLDVISGLDWKLKHDHLLYFPYDGQTEVPVKFNPSGEMPSPVPGVDARLTGYPITLTVYGGQKISDVTASLVDKDGNEVDFHISTPEKPSNPEEWGWSKIGVGIMPKKHLKPKTTYTVKVDFKLDGKATARQWTFTTRGVQKRTAEEHNQAGLDLFAKERYAEALKEFAEAVRLKPEMSVYRYNRGLCRYHLADYAEGIADFSEALRLNPKYAAALEMRGYCRYMQKKWQPAVDDLEAAGKMDDSVRKRAKEYLDHARRQLEEE